MQNFKLKATLTIILVSINSDLLISQTDTSWYRHYVMDSMELMFLRGIEPCGNDAVVFVVASPPIHNPLVNSSSLLRIDGLNGDILWNTRMIFNAVAEASQVFFNFRGMLRLQDGSFVVLMDTYTTEGKTGFTLHRISNDGAVLWHKDFGVPGQDIIASTGGLAIGPDSMSFGVSARRADIENPSSSLLLYHFDEDGEVIHQFNLNTGLQYYYSISPLAMLADSSFVVGYNLGSFDISAPKWLSHISNDGQVIDTHVAWDFGWWSDLKRHPNGNIVAISQSFSGEWENRENHGLRTTMYNPTLDTIWSRVYNHFEGPHFYREIDFPGGASFDPQGNILVTGDGSALNFVRPAHMVSYTPDGYVRWVKRLGFGEDVAGYLQSIGGKIAFHPNGILLAGSIGLNEMLLVRLDSSGCLVETDCDTDFLLALQEVQGADTFDFLLLPNPAGDHVVVSVPEDQLQGVRKPIIHIIDIMGKIIASELLTEPVKRLDIIDLPSGVYFVIIESNGATIGSRKFVKR